MADPGLGPIGQISRRVSDVEASVAWYRDVLGLPHLFTFGPLAFFDCDGTRLYLTATGQGVPGEDSVVYFRVPDIHASYTELAERGVRFSGPPSMIHRHDDGVEEWMAFFEDPDGGTLALMSRGRPGGP